MPLDELKNPPSPPTDWSPLDASLLGESRPTPPAFPLHLLPGRWRAWVEASSRLFGSADYLAHCLLGGVAAAGGAGIRIEVASHWREPLLLWQALVGGPSSGRSAAFARVRALLDAVGAREAPGSARDVESGAEDEKGGPGPRDRTAPSVLVDAGLDPLCWALDDGARGVLLWREDLGDWMEAARRRPGSHAGANPARPAWLAAWSAGPAVIDGYARDCFAVGIAGALSPGVAGGFSGGDSALASRFLYVWPQRSAAVSLVDTDAGDARLVALLARIAAFAGDRETPTVVPFDTAAARRLEALMPAIQRAADSAEEEGAGGAAAEWIARGVATIVRLAGVLSLMAWAESRKEWLPVGAAHLEAAYALWSDYYLPHALAVFDRSGTRPGDRAARRVVRWLRRVRAPQISREDVRREALCQSVDADGAEEVLARLEAGGFLRPVAVTEPTRRGPRRRRWEVNPLLWPAIGAISATPLPPPAGT